MSKLKALCQFVSLLGPDTNFEISWAGAPASSRRATTSRGTQPESGVTKMRTNAGRPATTGAFFCPTSPPFCMIGIFTPWYTLTSVMRMPLASSPVLVPPPVLPVLPVPPVLPTLPVPPVLPVLPKPPVLPVLPLPPVPGMGRPQAG